MRHEWVAIALAMGLGAAAETAADEALRNQASSLFGRIEAAPYAPTPEIELGRALFWDTRLSLDGKTACASCHLGKDWGSDSRRYSTDARAKLTSRHSQTIFNVLGQPALRWLGDRKSGADQAEGSITGSMGFASKQDMVTLMGKLDYLPAFRAAYPAEPDPLSARNYGRAIETYEATLVTPAPFDRFLAGEDGALTEAQKGGLRAFIANGCAGCHSGPLLGGTLTQRFGVVKDYWQETGSEKVDVGRFAATKKEEDRYVFRVAMLRNIAKTAPYFHDGSVDSLDRAVKIMASVQLGRALDDAAASSIVSFLESLTGDVPPHYAPPVGKPSR